MSHPFMDLEGLGFGHKDDQVLSPKLSKYVTKGAKFDKPETNR